MVIVAIKNWIISIYQTFFSFRKKSTENYKFRNKHKTKNPNFDSFLHFCALVKLMKGGRDDAIPVLLLFSGVL